MCVLAHFLEEEGIATTLIALIRLHAERSRPPRALWVPFELGRPFGAPGNPLFQTRVINAALALLERDDGPVILEDFDDDEPDTEDDSDWQPPKITRTDDLVAEVLTLGPIFAARSASTGRTTVGLSRLEMNDAAAFIARLDSSDPLPNPRADLADVLLMRYAVDDLKAYYLESASATGHPSSRQLNGWLWHETQLARCVWSLLRRSFDHRDEKRRHAAWWLVPDAYADRATVERIWSV